MKPQVGYLVQYHLQPDETHKNNGSLLAAAVITRVFSDECVNLKVLFDGPETGWMTSVIAGKEARQWSPIELHLEAAVTEMPKPADDSSAASEPAPAQPAAADQT